MPEVTTGQDGSFADSAVVEEAAKVETARAELYDEATGGESQGGELILGKYQSVDDLAQAYQSLQAEYSRVKNGQAPAEEAPAESQAADQGDDDEDEGDSPEPESDITREQAEAIRENVLRQVGGEKQYQRLATWAANNLEEGRLEAFNVALAQGSEPVILSLLKGLQYDFMMSNGYEPRLSGGRAPSNEVKGFSSEAQVVEAMNDPRYSGPNPDPAYIKEVERRIAVSNVFQSR